MRNTALVTGGAGFIGSHVVYELLKRGHEVDVLDDLSGGFVAKNYLGLIQIRNYGKYSWLLREIGLMLKYRWQNLFSLLFWFFSLGCAILPESLLIPMVDAYKKHVLAKSIGSVDFQYQRLPAVPPEGQS